MPRDFFSDFLFGDEFGVNVDLTLLALPAALLDPMIHVVPILTFFVLPNIQLFE